jgi:hypothetical protein
VKVRLYHHEGADNRETGLKIVDNVNYPRSRRSQAGPPRPPHNSVTTVAADSDVSSTVVIARRITVSSPRHPAQLAQVDPSEGSSHPQCFVSWPCRRRMRRRWHKQRLVGCSFLPSIRWPRSLYSVDKRRPGRRLRGGVAIGFEGIPIASRSCELYPA